MYQKDPIIQVKPSDNDGFSVITITGPDAEKYAQMMRDAIARDRYKATYEELGWQ